MTPSPPGVFPWVGTAFRHISSQATHDVLDFDLAGLQPDSRWNDPGQRTLYLAGDPGTTIAEWGRHFPTVFGSDPPPRFLQRDIYQLRIKLDAIMDVRHPQIAEYYGLLDAPNCFLDRDKARYLSNRVRNETSAQGIMAPSVAFLDDMSRWNLVVFLEKLPADTSSWITEVKKIGPLRWR